MRVSFGFIASFIGIGTSMVLLAIADSSVTFGGSRRPLRMLIKRVSRLLPLHSRLIRPVVTSRRASPVTVLLCLPILAPLVVLSTGIALDMVIMDSRHGFRANMISPRMVLLDIFRSVLMVVVFPFIVSLIAAMVNIMHALRRLWW